MATQRVSSAGELQSAVSNAGAGDEIIAEDGVYDMSGRWTVHSGGSSGNHLVIRAADGANPHIRFAAGGSNDDDSGIQFRSPYVTFRGFEVSGSGWKGVNLSGSAHDSVMENLSIHNCNIWGLMNNGNDNVVFRNCDSFDNMGGDGDNSDGINMTGPARNGLIEGCRAWNNGDDGFDFWVSHDHTIRYCMAWNNGRGSGGDGNGFKLGGGPNDGGGHLIHHCVSFNNRYRGFDWNTTDQPLEVYNNTSVGNQINYRFNEDGPYTLRNNISMDGDVQISSGVDDQYNSWNLSAEPEFVSLDPSSEDFLKLPDGHPYVNAGVDVGLDFEGSAPTLGAMAVSDSGSGGGGGSDANDLRLESTGATPRMYVVVRSTGEITSGIEHEPDSPQVDAVTQLDNGDYEAIVQIGPSGVDNLRMQTRPYHLQGYELHGDWENWDRTDIEVPESDYRILWNGTEVTVDELLKDDSDDGGDDDGDDGGDDTDVSTPLLVGGAFVAWRYLL